ncbi:MAG: YigZ family protein [Bacteroidales bacterium]|nr:YigZ family protein [Bacteroidales bacterium]MBN2764582.1 YigZ family protein [Bacteroidales bacterium]
MKNTFKTIAGRSEGQYKERGSKFLAFGFPVTDETTIKSIITSIRKEYHDARHHCYAWRIGHHPFRYRTYDDGEPSGTAGKPIYGQIVSNALTDVLIVVVRYFGGTLLGTGGLINAYRTAAAQMINNASIIEKQAGIICRLTFPYASLNGAMKILKDEGVIFTDQVYDNTCALTVNIPRSSLERFKNKLALLDGMICNEIGEVRLKT